MPNSKMSKLDEPATSFLTDRDGFVSAIDQRSPPACYDGRGELDWRPPPKSRTRRSSEIARLSPSLLAFTVCGREGFGTTGNGKCTVCLISTLEEWSDLYHRW